eukprot:UN14101
MVLTTFCTTTRIASHSGTPTITTTTTTTADTTQLMQQQ